jgi:hypothetical protein
MDTDPAKLYRSDRIRIDNLSLTCLHALYDTLHLISMKCALAMVYLHFNLIIFIQVKLRAGEFVCEYAGEVLGAEAARNRLQLQMQVDRISQDMQRLQFFRLID